MRVVDTVVAPPARSPRKSVQPSLKQAPQIDRITHPIFIFAWLGNFTLVAANAATFIFADWIAWVASSSAAATSGSIAPVYSEELPGRIIQTGLAAAIISRLFLGKAIDRYGVRSVWISLSFLMLTGSGIFVATRDVSTLLYSGRIMYAVGLAGMFTCSAFHMQSCVAEHRRTEFLGLLGSAGFIGMIAGTQFVDLLRRTTDGDPTCFRYVFIAVMALNVVYVILTWLVTRDFPKPNRGVRPSLLRMMWTYWPGPVVLVSMLMGLVFVIPSVYLVRFNRHAGLGGISGYWTAYAISAFALRVLTARLSQRVGRYRLISVGLTAQGIGLLAIIPATESWHLIGPALLSGLGHALLFPSMVSLGAGRFPAKYRGSGTNLAMGFMDLGTALSASLLGRIIDLEMFAGAGYRPMFATAGIMALMVAAFWYLWHRTHIDSETTGG